ncbi:DNA-binding transcriptional regulator YhcF (GntR family) [Leucobacter exalbidus]|uniref:DNA-binding transcriptional regulator YhcF (GntR family) n=1 Tax=Leucobacter exalbidus TaxID=662960 RepID=A0A940PP98_9MICO|nr:DNA-binding transcriptional regulator YhcF (GntR family) [Leucobacter exalbidus]
MFDDTRPIFQQLADRLADEILRGVYREEEQVPSTNELAVQLRINPATAGKALTLLVERGVLYKKRGIGMFVAPNAPAIIETERQQAFSARYLVPLLAEARALGLSPSDIIELIENATSESSPQPVKDIAS